MSDFYTKIETVKDLKEALNHLDDDCPIVLGTWNGYADTYTIADHAWVNDFCCIEADFFGTPGKMDRRLFSSDFCDKKMIYIGSRFHRNVDNEAIDFADDPNTPIHLINGEGGNHNMFWEHNNFEFHAAEGSFQDMWVYRSTEQEAKDSNGEFVIRWYPCDHSIYVWKENTDKTYVDEEGHNCDYELTLPCVGVYDFINTMKLCGIKKSWHC